MLTARLPRLNQFIVDRAATTSTAQVSLPYRDARFAVVKWDTIYTNQKRKAYMRAIQDHKGMVFAYKPQPRMNDSEADVA